MFLRLHRSTPMCMINEELGLKEISEYIENRMINFWSNIATGEESKFSTILYKWAKILYDKIDPYTYKSIWIDKVKATLNNTEMSHLLNEITNEDKAWIKKNTKTRLNNIYAQSWSESVSTNSTCLNYRVMTIVKKPQNYILKLPKQYVYALCKFKCANHRMPIVNGRCANIPVEEKVCTLCQTNKLEVEFHYLFECPFFQIQRATYLPRYYYILPNMYKMMQLFESSDAKEMLNLVKFADIIIRQFR